MSVADFFHQAFIGALHRLPVAEALEEARLATRTCVEYWEKERDYYAVPVNVYATQMPIDSIPIDALVTKRMSASGDDAPGRAASLKVSLG